MNIELFTPFPAQKNFLDKYIDTDDLFGCLVAPRGSGKSLAAMNIALYWALSKNNQKLGWCAPTFSQSKNILDQIVTAANEVIEASNRQEATITFINGSTIKFLSADSADNIRGFRFTHLILDEFAYMKESVVNTVLLPTLNPLGVKCLMVSTPAGKNHFYNWFMKEEVVSHRIKLSDCPYIKPELIEEAKRSLPPNIFAQEYEAEFTDASSDVFQNLNRVASVGLFTLERRGDAYVGIDTGIQEDMSVLTIMSPMGRVLWIEAVNRKNINDIAEQFMSIMGNFNVVGGYIEVNGIGRSMYDLVSRRYKKVKEFTTTQDSKADMVRKLLNDIETLAIELPSEDLCPELHREMASYTYKLSNTGKLSFSHPNGGHDDYVDSLMLANYSRVQFMEKRPIRITGINNIRPTFGSTR